MNKIIIPITLCALLVIAVVYTATHRYKILTLSGAQYQVDVVSTERSLQRGLSGKTEMPFDYGMLFAFGRPGEWGIWMKDMNFPIDIIWLDQDFKVVHFEKNVSPGTYPKVFTPSASAWYVLELSAGQIEQQSISIGDFATLSK
jgi:uncharacterized membrane protein (UPF0127 family)